MKAFSPTARRVRLGVVVLAALFVTSCGSSAKVGAPAADTKPGTPPTASITNTVSAPTTPPTPSSGAGAAPDAFVAPAVVPPILQISSPLVGGSELDAASFVGKPVAFWFWAPT